MRLLLVVLFASLTAAIKRFDGDEVLTLHPRTPAHLQLLMELEKDVESVDFWNPDTASAAKVGGTVDVRFPRHSLGSVKAQLQKENMAYEVKINDVQKLISQQFNMKTNKATSDYDYNIYHTYDEIQQWISDIAAEYPSLARQSLLTTSTEGREVNMLTLGSSTDKPIFLIDCGVHAREWIAPATCQCFIHQMLSQYGIDAEFTRLMDEMTWVIVPVLNVDGYEYSWTSDRMWRKTRSNYGTYCTGVDANRNFDINWSGEGASTDPCSSTYCGPGVESEPIVKALSDIIRNNAGNVKGYIAFHSYSQVFVYPYSYDYKDAPNADQLFDVSQRAAQAIHDTSKKTYTYGPGYDSMYLVSGGSKDMALNNGVPLSWTIELRDTGRYGFLLPESQIQGTCDEIYQAMFVIAEEAITNT